MHRETGKLEAFEALCCGDLATAKRLYNKLIRRAPRDAELLYYMGVLCHQDGRDSESAQWLRSALSLAPKSLPTLQLLVRICVEAGDAAGSLDNLNQYLALQPGDAAMLHLKGQQLAQLGRLDEAEPVFRQAAVQSGIATMYHDLGLCRQLLGDKAGAANAYEEAIRRGYDHPDTWLWLVQCLRAIGRAQDYYQVATDATAAVPGDIRLLIEAQSARRYVCDWDGFEVNQPQLLTSLSQVLNTKDAGTDIPPGILNYLEIDEGMIAAMARRYARQLSAVAEPRHTSLRQGRLGDRIRLGYLSTDFFAHAVGSLVRDLFAGHDRNRFEVYGYSLRHQPDAVQTLIEQGCDAYRNLSGRSAAYIGKTIAEDRIDILIDLAGYTSAAKPTVLASRPAPVQIAWLGYLGTSGGDFIDYVIGDNVVLPPVVARNFSERIIRLPVFLVASSLPVVARGPSRQDVGLGEEGVVFCSFNQLYKLDRPTFRAWMEILQAVPGSRLWLYAADTQVGVANLRREAMRCDVDPDRLVFALRQPMAEHLARIALADLALDPFHISGGATSVMTVAAGVPILTLRGDSFLARMGSSINTHLGLDDLDTTDPAQYIAKAVSLATTPSELAAVKERLSAAVQARGFFDTAAYTRLLEQALLTVWERHESGSFAADVNIMG